MPKFPNFAALMTLSLVACIRVESGQCAGERMDGARRAAPENIGAELPDYSEC